MGMLYKDGLVEITAQQVVFKRYFFPFGGEKRVSLDCVERIEATRPSISGGRWRIWGTGDFRTWFPLDRSRPERDTIFIMVLRGRSRRIGFTVEDSGKVMSVFRELGLSVVADA